MALLIRALDTNVVIRYLVNDDPIQEQAANRILRLGFLLSATVLMETEWVLRAVYRWPRASIHAALTALIDLPSAISIPDGIHWALDRFAQGADLADMMHIVSATGATAYATFDANIAAKVVDSGPLPIETLP